MNPKLTETNILRQRRARGWLDDNTTDWGPSQAEEFYAYVNGYGDSPIYADNIVELCIKGCELNGDTFRP